MKNDTEKEIEHLLILKIQIKEILIIINLKNKRKKKCQIFNLR